ncbi:MAG: CvpA family protein [Pirellulales bacterium]|nr:CvpA family protein [Pirellulales bacterium]
MSWILPLLMLLIFVACVATCYSEGTWSNAIMLINIITATILAVNFFEPLAKWLEGWQPTYTYIWDFLSLWGLFALSMLIFRLLTDTLSRVKVRFLKIADRIGSGVLSVAIGWVMICFTMMTLHTAPLSRTFLWEGFRPQERMIMGLGPDRQWLGLMKRTSKGVFSRAAPRPFGPSSKFINTYETRRSNLEEHIKKNNSLRVR